VADLTPRPVGRRYPRNVVIVVTEGETERIFFNSLKQRNLNLEIRLYKGKRTNARQLVENCVKRIQMEELDLEDGDIIICAFDVDNNSQKDLKQALDTAEKNGITVALSNPCFELWYLLHFRDIDHRISSKEVRTELSTHVKHYDKTQDYREILTPRRRGAVVRAKTIAKKRCITGMDGYSDIGNNPCTSVHLALNAIERLIKKNLQK